MIRTENDCVGCDRMFGYCKATSCPKYWHYDVLVCDECGAEVDELYKVDDKELCADCILAQYEKIT